MSEQNKRKAAEKAIAHLSKLVNATTVLGIGSGTTTNIFIELLGNSKLNFKCAVASSVQTQNLLIDNNIKTVALEELKALDTNIKLIDFYIDGADEIDNNNYMIKGGGAALTGEKILASAAKTFICIADSSKKVRQIGTYPLPIEYVKFAEPLVIKTLEFFNGSCIIRDGVTSDYGNPIVDVTGIDFSDPLLLEHTLNNVPGIITNGIFAKNKADFLYTEL